MIPAIIPLTIPANSTTNNLVLYILTHLNIFFNKNKLFITENHTFQGGDENSLTTSLINQKLRDDLDEY